MEKDLREADYLELVELSTELGIPVPLMNLAYRSIDHDGNVLVDKQVRAHSYTRNFYNLFFIIVTNRAYVAASAFGAGTLDHKQGDGTVRALSQGGGAMNLSGVTPYCDWYTQSGAGVDGSVNSQAGLLVGTGTAAYSFENYILATKISHGTSAGQLVYQAMMSNGYWSGAPELLPDASYAAGTKKWTQVYTRTFNNNSGGDITVNEVALCIHQPVYSANSTQNYKNVTATGYELICRDLISGGTLVANGGQLVIAYNFELTFPA